MVLTPDTSAAAALASGGMSVAVKLMKSMGWTEGEGLGKERQGIAAPIILQKTDTRTGVMVNAQPMAGACLPVRLPPTSAAVVPGLPFSCELVWITALWPLQYTPAPAAYLFNVF